jgi:hypothetical protein
VTLCDTTTEIDVRLIEELNQPPACEGPNHPTGKYGHVVNEPAAWMLTMQCGHDWLSCDSWLKQADADSSRLATRHWYVECDLCGEDTYMEDMGPDRTEAGVVYRDEEGTLRITKPADADPYAPDGLPVDATWVLIVEWKAS